MSLLEKIKQRWENLKNNIQFNRVKKQILNSQYNNDNATMELTNDVINQDVIEMLLNDEEVTQIFLEEGTMCSMILSLKDNEKVIEYGENELDKFTPEEKLNFFEQLQSRVEPNILLKSEVGKKFIEQFPKEALDYVKDMDNEELKKMQISKWKITEKTMFSEEDKKIKYKNNIDKILDKISQIEFAMDDVVEGIKTYTELNRDGITKIIENEDLSEDAKKQIFEQIEVDDDFECNYFENEDLLTNPENCEYKNILKSRIRPEKVKEYIRRLEEGRVTSGITKYYSEYVKKIYNIISEIGLQKTLEVAENKGSLQFVNELYSLFQDKEIRELLTYSNSDALEINFYNKMIGKKWNVLENREILENIYAEEGTLLKYKGYLNFRMNHTDLDLRENMMLTLREYQEYGKLYEDIIRNLVNATPEEIENAKTRFNELMQLDNKFKIETYEEFENFDEIERQYYQQQLDSFSDINTKMLNNYKELCKEKIDLQTHGKGLYKQKLKKVSLAVEVQKILKNSICEILIRHKRMVGSDLIESRSYEGGITSDIDDVLDLISTINEIDDIDSLKGIMQDAISLIGTPELATFRKMSSNIEEKLVNEYRNEFASSITRYEDMSIEEINQMEGIEACEIDGVKVIELKGVPFNFIAHNGTIDGDRKRTCCTWITDEHFEMFQNAGIAEGSYCFNGIKGNEIKSMKNGDFGFTSYDKRYVKPKNLVAGTERYNEVIMATGIEEVDGESLKPTSRVTKYKRGTSEFLEKLKEVKSENINTIYIFHEEIYREKQEVQKQRKNEYIKEYLQSLDPQFLQKLMISAQGDLKEKNEILKLIKEQIDIRIDNVVEPNRIKANIVRYNELSKGNCEVDKNLKGIIEQLQEVLSTKDNDVLAKKISLQETVKNTVDKNDKSSDESFGER